MYVGITAVSTVHLLYKKSEAVIIYIETVVTSAIFMLTCKHDNTLQGCVYYSGKGQEYCTFSIKDSF